MPWSVALLVSFLGAVCVLLQKAQRRVVNLGSTPTGSKIPIEELDRQ